MTGADFLGDVIRDLGGLDRDMVFTGGLVLPDQRQLETTLDVN